LIKRLKAAEVLGDATVIVTDKTGTITENKMKIVSVYPKNKTKEIIETAFSVLTELSTTPIDTSIMEKADELEIKSVGEVIRERNFGDGRKTKSVLRKVDGKLELFMSGAPEEVLGLTTKNRMFLKELRNETSKGRRVIAIAKKSILPSNKKLPFKKMEENLKPVGLISFEDPPRDGVKKTIDTTKRAGIRTIMVTGDHPQTAAFIAKSVGIESKKVLTGDDLDKMSDEELQEEVKKVSVFARTTPEHKYRIVKALHQNKEVVAVTGDGVNDVIALKEADIGIAMGSRGTDAAKEVADVVLADDNYNTIAKATFEGRKFFDNLKKGTMYYLSAKTALVLAFLLPIIFNIPFPFSPIQIIVLELFMDLAASSAFVAEPVELSVYRPIKSKKFMDSKAIIGILLSGLSLFAAVILPYFYARYNNLSLIQTQTFAFAGWMIGHIVLAFVSRSEKEPLFKLGIFSNRVMDLWALTVFVFLLVSIGIPAFSLQLKLSSLSIDQLVLILSISFLTISWKELVKIERFRKGSRKIF
jgi:Ca2+-transporting ATPase